MTPRVEPEPCNVCGGDGRIDNAWGQVAKCPSCHGSGKRREDTGFRDVTKTKESHHRNTNRQPVAEKQTWLSQEAKTKLTREIIDHESTHGQCTQTFLKKLRKQVRPAQK